MHTLVTTTIRGVEYGTPNRFGVQAAKIDTDDGPYPLAVPASYTVHDGLIGQLMILTIDQWGQVYGVDDAWRDERTPATVR